MGPGVSDNEQSEFGSSIGPPPYRLLALFRRATVTVLDPVPARTHLRAFGGTLTIDLEDHTFTADVTEIHVYSVFAMVNIYLPYGVNVENASTGWIGAFGGNARYAVGFSGPQVRLRGVAFFGGVGCYIRDK
jgi:hypothetical protein